MDDLPGTFGATVEFTLNGAAVSVKVPPGERLSETLRARCGARDVKVGCNAGDCGACTVLRDGAPVCACLTPSQQAAGAQIETAACLAHADPWAARLRAAFGQRGAAQCGICTPGMLVSAVVLLRRTPRPDEAAVQEALGGVLCRCTGYRAIIDAVVAAGQDLAEPASADGTVGTRLPRVDGAAKTAGTEVFGDDVAPADALVVKVLRAPHPHADFHLGDLTRLVAETPGLVTALTAANIPGVNAFGVIPGFHDQRVFAEITARFRGEAIAAIVGEPEAMRAIDLADLPVTWTIQPPAMDIAAATDPGAPQLHPQAEGNVLCRGLVQRGDAEAALAEADVIAEASVTTSFVEHAYIEPEAGFARPVGDRLELHVSTQAPAMNREQLARILGISEARIQIVPTAVGGGFGSKLDLSVQPYLALAALKTGRPVRMAYGRTESMQSTTKRHPAEIHLRVGARRDGTLCGLDFQGDFNTGAYASWGPTVANRVPVHASGPYRVADYRARSRGIYTHCPPAGAFRGFGVPQTAIAQETAFDDLAEQLGLDPLDFRLKNALTDGAETVTGQVLSEGVGIKACLEALKPGWAEAHQAAARLNADRTTTNRPLRRGVGIGAGWYGCGNTSLPNPSTIRAGLRADGTLVLHQGAVDIGQGSNTVIAQIFAASLGIEIDQVALLGADTDITPDAGKTSASRQTFVSGNAARLTALALRERILRLCNASADATIRAMPGTGRIAVEDPGQAHLIALSDLPPDSDAYVLVAAETYDPPTKPMDENGQGEPYAQFGYAAQIAVVDVDTRLGTVRPVRFIAAHDVGRAINPMLVEGQVHGGIAQGLGMALMEAFIPGRTENLHDYLIPTIGDVPPIETLIIEEADPHGPFGAKGLGEHALIPTAPAILNAIRHATGARITEVPATPDRVLAAIKAAGGV